MKMSGNPPGILTYKFDPEITNISKMFGWFFIQYILFSCADEQFFSDNQRP
jgi:hypothetical protein